MFDWNYYKNIVEFGKFQNEFKKMMQNNFEELNTSSSMQTFNNSVAIRHQNVLFQLNYYSKLVGNAYNLWFYNY